MKTEAMVLFEKQSECYIITGESGFKIKLWIHYDEKTYYIEPIKGDMFTFRGGAKQVNCYERQKEIAVLIYAAIGEVEKKLGKEKTE